MPRLSAMSELTDALRCCRSVRRRRRSFPDRQRRDDEPGQHHQRDDGKTPVECEHRYEGRRQDEHVLRDGHERARDDGVDAGDVARQPGHQLARPGLGVEPQGERLQPREHAQLEVVHDPLADDGVQVAPEHADQPQRHRSREQARGEPQQQRLVRSLDRRVDDAPHEQRRHESDEGRGSNREEDENEPEPVRREETEDTPEVPLAEGGLRLDGRDSTVTHRFSIRTPCLRYRRGALRNRYSRVTPT